MLMKHDCMKRTSTLQKNLTRHPSSQPLAQIRVSIRLICNWQLSTLFETRVGPLDGRRKHLAPNKKVVYN